MAASFWAFAVVGAALVVGWLFLSNLRAGDDPSVNEQRLYPFKDVLREIDNDVISGKLSPEEAVAAKGELARELIRSRLEQNDASGPRFGLGAMGVGALLVLALAFGSYGMLGSPHLPGQPLSERTASIGYESIVLRIQLHLMEAQDDADGWRALATLRMEMGEFVLAADAYRRALELGLPDADLQTDLAEALLLVGSREARTEAKELLRSAVTLEATHVRSRLYLASELTSTGLFEAAAPLWQQALDAAKGDEPWLEAARQGLAVTRGGEPIPVGQPDMISGMVKGLHARLFADGGNIEEWTQLVRSYLVLDDIPNAQRSYDAAVSAFPDVSQRNDLDSLALAAGLDAAGTEE